MRRSPLQQVRTPSHRVFKAGQGAGGECRAALSGPQMGKEHVFADIDSNDNHKTSLKSGVVRSAVLDSDCLLYAGSKPWIGCSLQESARISQV